jgi:hypothetical protein
MCARPVGTSHSSTLAPVAWRAASASHVAASALPWRTSTRASRLRQAAQQVVAPAEVAQLQQRRPPVVAAQRGFARAFGDAERLVHIRQAVLLAVDDDEQATEAQRGERVLVAVAERPGQLEGALGRRARGDRPLGQPLLPGQGDQGPDEPPFITVLLPEGGGRCRRRRKVELVAVGQRPRVGFAEGSPLGRRQPVSAGQDLGVAGRRLRVRADARGLPRRCLAVGHDGGGVAGLDRVVQDAERIAVRVGEKSAQHVRVQFQPDTGRQ